jgi:protein-tyrosine phosphatase
MIMASMRNWLLDEPQDVDNGKDGEGKGKTEERKKRKGRVVVVHCKAGKGRSGTMACSYLISECGWDMSEALARFTERRMRPGFGQGVSIPSQLRWVEYVDRWAKSGKVYVERQIEIIEVHVWGLRNGVKVQVEGFVDEGKTIKLFHVFTKKERVIVEGNAPSGGGVKSMIYDIAGFQSPSDGQVDDPADGRPRPVRSRTIVEPDKPEASQSAKPQEPSLSHLDGANESKPLPPKSRTDAPSSSSETTGTEDGGEAVIFRPSTRVILPSSDINIDFERRNKASMGWTMVTSVAHVWFNAYFEGNGPEQNGVPDRNSVFEIDWDKMDGIKGSLRKGTRAFDRLAVVWQAYDPGPGQGSNDDVIRLPGPDSPVPEMAPADWKGGNVTSPGLGKDLGLRTESPHSAHISKASSIKSSKQNEGDNDSMEGLRTSDLSGGEELDQSAIPSDDDTKRDVINKFAAVNLEAHRPQPDIPQHTLNEVNSGLNTASSTTPKQGSST